MGGGKSQTISQAFNLSSISRSIFTQITKNKQTLAASMNNIQELTLEIGLIKSGCDLDASQTINATSTASGRMDAQTIAETRDLVQAELQASAEAALDMTTELGNLEFGNKQNIRQDIRLEVEQVVEKTFTTENINEIYSEIVNLQEKKITIAVCDGKVNASQDIVAKLVTEAIMSSLSTAISDNQLLSELAAKSTAKSSMLNKGIEGIVNALMDPMKYASIASIVSCCVVLIIVLVFALSSSGKSSTGKGNSNSSSYSKSTSSRISGGRRVF